MTTLAVPRRRGIETPRPDRIQSPCNELLLVPGVWVRLVRAGAIRRSGTGGEV